MGPSAVELPRYPISRMLSIENHSDTELSAKTSDLSAGGMLPRHAESSPEGTEILVRISHAARHSCPGKSGISVPNMGMGVMF